MNQKPETKTECLCNKTGAEDKHSCPHYNYENECIRGQSMNQTEQKDQWEVLYLFDEYWLARPDGKLIARKNPSLDISKEDLEALASTLNKQAELEAENERLKSGLARDQSGLAQGLAEIVKHLEGYHWVHDGGSGPYSANEFEALRDELKEVMNTVQDMAVAILRESGKFSRSILFNQKDFESSFGLRPEEKELNAARAEIERLTAGIEQRIKELNEADGLFCKDRWDENLPKPLRDLARENSNQVTFARQELQKLIALLPSPVVPTENKNG